MKKKSLVLVGLMVGFLFIGINVFAADGDLIVNGNLTVQGVKLTRVTGTNPTCPSGTGGILFKKFAATTCTGSNPWNNCQNYGPISCTASGGWGTTTPSPCQYWTWDEMNALCAQAICTADTWTDAVCMGN